MGYQGAEGDGERRLLVIGASGHIGTHVAQQAHQHGFEEFGTARHSRGYLALDVNDYDLMDGVMVQIEPDAVIYCASRADEYALFGPVAGPCWDVNLYGVRVALEAVRDHRQPHARFLYVSTTATLDAADPRPSEATPIVPQSHYGAYALTKAMGQTLVTGARQAGMWACTAMLTEPFSAFMPPRFLAHRILRFAVRAASGAARGERIELSGRLASRGFVGATSIAAGLLAMLDMDTPRDLILAPTRTVRLLEFVTEVFAAVGLDHEDWVSWRELDAGEWVPREPDTRAAVDAIGWEYGVDELRRDVVGAVAAMREANVTRGDVA